MHERKKKNPFSELEIESPNEVKQKLFPSSKSSRFQFNLFSTTLRCNYNFFFTNLQGFLMKNESYALHNISPEWRGACSIEVLAADAFAL